MRVFYGCLRGPCAPLRRHHRAKQAQGWHLGPPEPGTSSAWPEIYDSSRPACTRRKPDSRPGRISSMQRIAVVTGASSGIGAATSVRLAEAGYHVVLAARRIDRIEALAERIKERGGQAEAHRLDVTDRAAVDALAKSLERCDVLVDNAGCAAGRA